MVLNLAAMPPSVPSSLVQLLSTAGVVGVSGSRRPPQASRRALALALASTPGLVITGCAPGIDQVARSRVPSYPVTKRLVGLSR